ncbi:MAG TPA: 2-phospho-L-lactate transferase, partial [Candidatus Binatus sp.]|nr:2-phospho-L-lactate transferase [Candidatus Binatus sp.]
ADRITVIANTGDDLEYLGLYISPDIDIVCYTLAGLVDQEKGWGLRGDTHKCMEQLEVYGAETWFRIGDRDLATHLLRAALLQQGFTLSEATDKIRTSLGVKTKIIPISNDRIATKIKTPNGLLEFQEYFVKRKFQDKVLDVIYDGAHKAIPSEGVAASIAKADAVIICPSNPILSIGPMLAVPGMREAMANATEKTVAVSPIVGGKSLKGPLDRIMSDLKIESSAYGVAQLYKGVAEGFVIDNIDSHLLPKIKDLEMKVVSTQSIMETPIAKANLAKETLRLAETL